MARWQTVLSYYRMLRNIRMAIILAKKAVQEDLNKNYSEAAELYQRAIRQIDLTLKSERIPESDKHFIKKRSLEYQSRRNSLVQFLETKKEQPKSQVEHSYTNTAALFCECKICYEMTDAESIWVLSCGHLPFCQDCLTKIWAKDENEVKCPICRADVFKIKAYFWGITHSCCFTDIKSRTLIT